jgi:hypothetical protein
MQQRKQVVKALRHALAGLRRRRRRRCRRVAGRRHRK